MILTIIATIILLGPIIFFHELGHFLAAKLSGVTVEKFSLGFPPTIISKRIGETEYALGAIPFGGYVRMRGEIPGNQEYQPSQGDLSSKSIPVRAIILAAGSIMNFVLAIFLFWAVLAFHGTTEASQAATVGSVIPESPADSAGLVEGDSVVQISGMLVSNWDEMAEIVHPSHGKMLNFEIMRGDSAIIIGITPASHTVATDTGLITVGLIGIGPAAINRPMGVFAAVPGAFIMLGNVFGAMWQFAGKAFETGLEPGDVGGPVLISKMAGISARLGWATFIFFMAALSVNLGILNLLPFPVLDGGHLLFLCIEGIRRRPVSIKIRLAAQQIGFLIIVAFMIYITFNDFFVIFGD